MWRTLFIILKLLKKPKHCCDQVASYSVVQSKPLSSSNSPRYLLGLAALLNYLFRLTPFFRLCLCVFCSRSAGGRVGSPINSAGRRRNEASGTGQYCNMLYTHHQKSARASKILFSSFVNTYQGVVRMSSFITKWGFSSPMSDWNSPLYLAFLHPINLTESGTVEFPFPHLLSIYIQYW